MENILNTITLSYQKQIHRRSVSLAAVFGLTLMVGIYAVTRGAYDLSPMQAIRALLGSAGEGAAVVVWNIRLPRIIASLVVGWGLSLSGLGIQSLLRNPLGSPSTLGISQGSAFGAAAAIVFFGAGIVSVTFFAFMGAMAATMIILILARLKRLSPEAIILSGVALSALFGSATILVQYLATDIQLAAVVFWTFGDVARSSWREIGLLTLVVSLLTVYFMTQRWDLNALDSGEEAARGLGVNVERLRIQGMVVAALIAALATAFHGVIAFVGLIAPHMARRLVGADHCLLIPFSAVLGALLLLSADTIGRVLVGSGALPVGVITSFLGAPMFIFLLVRAYR
jgi:iron complex transport system permease protein